jgi:hypothetical protein
MKLNQKSRRFFLLSQMFFASVCAILWIPLALGAFYTFWFQPFRSLFILIYGLAALLLFIRWGRSRKSDRTSNVDNLASVGLWLIPVLISLGGIGMILFEQFDGKPHVINDCDYRPMDYIAFPVWSAIWFGIPLLYSVLLAKGDWHLNQARKGK